MQPYSAVFNPRTTAQTAPCDGHVIGFGNYTNASQESEMNMIINNITPTDLKSVNGIYDAVTGYKYMMASCKKGDTVKLFGIVNSVSGMIFFSD